MKILLNIVNTLIIEFYFFFLICDWVSLKVNYDNNFNVLIINPLVKLWQLIIFVLTHIAQLNI